MDDAGHDLVLIGVACGAVCVAALVIGNRWYRRRRALRTVARGRIELPILCSVRTVLTILLGLAPVPTAVALLAALTGPWAAEWVVVAVGATAPVWTAWFLASLHLTRGYRQIGVLR